MSGGTQVAVTVPNATIIVSVNKSIKKNHNIPSITPDKCAGGACARCRWSGARGGDTGSALIFTLLGDAAGGDVPPSTGRLLLLMEKCCLVCGCRYLHIITFRKNHK